MEVGAGAAGPGKLGRQPSVCASPVTPYLKQLPLPLCRLEQHKRQPTTPLRRRLADGKCRRRFEMCSGQIVRAPGPSYHLPALSTSRKITDKRLPLEESC